MSTDVTQAQRHKTLSFPTGILDPTPVALFVNATGTADIVLGDETGVNTSEITYNLTVGAILPVRPQQITGGTATVIALY